MLNLNSPKTQNLKANRLDELLDTITEARRSLQDWQDKRTEALIQLDALSYDLRQIEEEKTRSSQLIAALKNEIEDRAKVYQSHVESITDQMQMLKVEKDEVEKSLNEAVCRIQKQLDESELQRNRQRDREAEIIANWEARVAEQKSEFEVKIAEQGRKHINEVEGLSSEINALLEKIEVLKAQLAEAEIRGDRNDRELQVIRSQMMNVLKVSEAEKLSDFFKPMQAATVGANAPTPARSPNPYIVQNSEALLLATQGKNQNGEIAIGAKTRNEEKVETRPHVSNNGAATQGLGENATVDDYLKRFGY